MAALPSSYPRSRRRGSRPALRVLEGGGTATAPQPEPPFTPSWEWPVAWSDDTYRRSPARLAGLAGNGESDREGGAARPEPTAAPTRALYAPLPAHHLQGAELEHTPGQLHPAEHARRAAARRAAARRRQRELARRRLRVLSFTLSLSVLGAGWVGLSSLLNSPAHPRVLAGAVASKSGYRYVARPGDTLWSIASRLEPGVDPRPLVDELASELPGGVLVVGDTLQLP